VLVDVKSIFTLNSKTYSRPTELLLHTTTPPSLLHRQGIVMAPSITFKPNRPPRFSRKGAALLTSLTIVLILTLYLTHRHPSLPTLETIPWIPTRFPSDTRIAKATIAYTPLSNDRSLALHSTHNAAFGYEMHVLRRPIVRGFANTLLWLQHLIVSEMLKNVEERVEWIMYVFISFSLLPYRVSFCCDLSLRFLELNHRIRITSINEQIRRLT
jgi:hypothetical protein